MRNFRASEWESLLSRNERSRKCRVCETNAEIAQLVEHNLAKVGVASSSLVFRSLEQQLAVFFVCVCFVEFLVRKWGSGSNRELEVRFAVVVAMCYFLNDECLDKAFERINGLDFDRINQSIRPSKASQRWRNKALYRVRSRTMYGWELRGCWRLRWRSSLNKLAPLSAHQTCPKTW